MSKDRDSCDVADLELVGSEANDPISAPDRHGVHSRYG